MCALTRVVCRWQILLDFGLAEELTPRVRRHFISFLHAISKGDAAAGARHMLEFGAVQVWRRRHLLLSCHRQLSLC